MSYRRGEDRGGFTILSTSCALKNKFLHKSLHTILNLWVWLAVGFAWLHFRMLLTRHAWKNLDVFGNAGFVCVFIYQYFMML